MQPSEYIEPVLKLTGDESCKYHSSAYIAQRLCITEAEVVYTIDHHRGLIGRLIFPSDDGRKYYLKSRVELLTDLYDSLRNFCYLKCYR